jgi:exopolysaccharide biosynthesis polyprenyl glycosylphosphotransferase
MIHNGFARTEAPEQIGLSLPRTDVRRRMDDAARRGWIEIGWGAARVSLLAISDATALFIAAIATALTLRAIGVPAGRAEVWEVVRSMLFLQPLVLGVVGAFAAGYNRISFGRVGLGITGASVLAFLQARFLQGAPGATTFTGTATVILVVWATMVVYVARLAIDRVVNRFHQVGFGQRRVLVIGSELEMAKTVRMLNEQGASEIRVVGRISPTFQRDAGALDAVADLESAIQSTDTWGVIVASSALSFEALETVFHRCFELGVAVSVIPKSLHRLGSRLELRKTRAGALLRLHPRELGIPQLTIKRAMDLSLSIVLLALFWPVLLLIAIAIKLDSPGPVFFKQMRAGLGGQPFGMFKLRTMVADAEDLKDQLHHLNESGDPRLFKIRNDPRVTRVGRFLRMTSLDELPQLFNVLRGEMSLIGPRPFFPDDVNGYANHHLERLSVLPGITGWWQVRGRSAVLDFEEVVRLDREYIEHWSFWFDLKILVLTLPTIVRRTGAY